MLGKINSSIQKKIPAAFVLLVLSAIAAHFAEAQVMFNDSDIRSAIVADLKSNEAVPAQLIDVGVSNGIVTLDGSVYNILARDKAVLIAQSTKGVRSVVSLIKVNPVIRTDEEIKQDIIAALSVDPATDKFEIDVRVKNAVAALSGKVDSVAEKILCEEVVKGVKGVREIHNNIIADVKPDRPDEEIKADIQQLLISDVLLNSDKIDVAVQNGVVELTGTVKSAVEKTQAMAKAWVSGVKNVENNIEVHWPDNQENISRRQNIHRTDVEIETAVRDAFEHDPRVQPFDLQIYSDEGTVTLRGKVDNLKARMAAEDDAENTTGVWSVINEIDVRPGNTVPDDLIEKMVMENFKRNPYLERHKFSVESYNGNVFIYGITNSRFEKEEAEKVAASVRGVVDVQNVINVRTQWPYRNDWEIKRDIKSQLYWSPFVDSDAITVTVEDGVTTLTGEVKNWSEYSLAAENAYEGGARSVQNHLQVTQLKTP